MTYIQLEEAPWKIQENVILKSPLNRIINIILGLFFAIFQFTGVAYSFSRFSISVAYLVLMQTVVFVIPALIVWFAYQWANEEK